MKERSTIIESELDDRNQTNTSIPRATAPVRQPARRTGRIIAAMLILAALLGSGFFFLSRKKSADSKTAAATATSANASTTAVNTGAPTPAPPVEVTTAAAISRELPRSLEVVGSLAADEEVIVSAQIAGEIAAFDVDFGSFVKQGQTIAIIDQRDAQLKVEQAEAALKQTMARLGMKDGEKFDVNQNSEVRVVKSQLDWARLDLDRNTMLVEKGDIPRSQHDLAKTNYNAANARYQAAVDAINQQLALIEQQRAAVNLAKKGLGDTVVRAPITGLVKEKFTARGAFLGVGNRIVTLVRINPLRLRADIPESSAASVRVGQIMTLSTEALPDRTFTGRVARIGASLNEQTRALTVEATVTNPTNLLRPGMFAKSQLILQQRGAVVMIPNTAIQRIAGINKVFVIENGKAIERVVQTGVTDGGLIEITSGVEAGETVATSNADKLQTGTVVKG